MKTILNHFYSPFGIIAILSLNIGLFTLFYAQAANSQSRMSNDQFIIRFGNLNTAAGNSSNSEFGLGQTVGQIAPGLYSGTNFKVRAGFQYIHSIIPFAFSISSQFVDFGPITPGAPVTRTNVLTVSNGSAYGYTVLASENNPLRVDSTGVDIPDTTCDTGTCNEQVAAAWSSVLTYGFGYRCDNLTGADCQSGFQVADNYRQFASSSSGELAFPVMRGVNVGRNIQSQITYKVNISPTQPAGLYQNIITYIATPSI